MDLSKIFKKQDNIIVPARNLDADDLPYRNENGQDIMTVPERQLDADDLPYGNGNDIENEKKFQECINDYYELGQ